MNGVVIIEVEGDGIDVEELLEYVDRYCEPRGFGTSNTIEEDPDDDE